MTGVPTTWTKRYHEPFCHVWNNIGAFFLEAQSSKTSDKKNYFFYTRQAAFYLYKIDIQRFLASFRMEFNHLTIIKQKRKFSPELMPNSSFIVQVYINKYTFIQDYPTGVWKAKTQVIRNCPKYLNFFSKVLWVI